MMQVMPRQGGRSDRVSVQERVFVRGHVHHGRLVERLFVFRVIGRVGELLSVVIGCSIGVLALDSGTAESSGVEKGFPKL